MAEVTPRVRRVIERQFPIKSDALQVAALAASASAVERVQAAIVIAGGNDVSDVADQAEVAWTDRRDVLINAGLAGDDWPRTLAQNLGGAS